MDSDSRSLHAVFAEAEAKRTQLDGFSSSSSPDYQAILSSALSIYSECLQIADRVSLFSPNESLEDIASNELQYLVVDYYLAELTLKRTTELAERGGVLDTARRHYERFLKLLDSYDILGKSDTSLWEQYRENRENFAVTMTADAAARREQKISRFKAEKELKRKLEVCILWVRMHEA
jgi:immunoglobulin-binding protein 1